MLDPFSLKVLSLQVTVTVFPALMPFKTVGELLMVLSLQTERIWGGIKEKEFRIERA